MVWCFAPAWGRSTFRFLFCFVLICSLVWVSLRSLFFHSVEFEIIFSLYTLVFDLFLCS